MSMGVDDHGGLLSNGPFPNSGEKRFPGLKGEGLKNPKECDISKTFLFRVEKESSTMKCPHCGKDIGGRKCSSCGSEVVQGSLFCHQCGMKLELPPAEPDKGEDVTVDFSRRILCSDGNCIGVINEQGFCKVCGKPYTGEAK
jgi:hypothetical protein